MGDRRVSRLFLSAAALWAVACAPPSSSAPVVPQGDADRVGRGGVRGAILIENERGVVTDRVDAPVEAVYKAVARVYSDLEIPVTLQDATEGVVAAEGFRLTRIDGRRPNRWVDCGTDIAGPVANDSYVTATVATFVETQASGGTAVHTQVEASAQRRDSATGELHCTTTGRLEALILERIQTRLPR